MLGCLDLSPPCRWHSAIAASSNVQEEQRQANFEDLRDKIPRVPSEEARDRLKG